MHPSNQNSTWTRCRRCRLYQSRRNVVLNRTGYTVKGVYVDSPNILSKYPHLLFLSEAPGKQEDHTGLPFQGASGRILHQIFKLSEANFNYTMTNLVGCRPTEVGKRGKVFNREPTLPEITACQPRLDELVMTTAFDGVVYLGKLAADYKPKEHLGEKNLFYRSLELTSPSIILGMEFKLYTMKIQARNLQQYVDSTQTLRQKHLHRG